MELRKTAEDNGQGMGIAAGTIKYAIDIIKTAEKNTKDSGTKTACAARQKKFTEEYGEVSL
jgi:hypothetical protein